MSHEITFHLVDTYAIDSVLRQLVYGVGSPPSFSYCEELDYLKRAPMSPFAGDDDADERWAEAREIVKGDDVERGARLACRLALRLTSASLPFVRIPGFGFTYRPESPDPAFDVLPDLGFESPARSGAFRALFNRRPSSRNAIADALDGPEGIGARLENLNTALIKLRKATHDLPDVRRRLMPLLALTGAARRLNHASCPDRFDIWEASGSGDSEPVRPELLHWPGIDRFGLAGDPLTAQEWSRLADAGVSAPSDMWDVLERAREIAPDDEVGVRAFIRIWEDLDFVDQSAHRNLVDGGLPTNFRRLERKLSKYIGHCPRPHLVRSRKPRPEGRPRWQARLNDDQVDPWLRQFHESPDTIVPTVLDNPVMGKPLLRATQYSRYGADLHDKLYHSPLFRERAGDMLELTETWLTEPHGHVFADTARDIIKSMMNVRYEQSEIDENLAAQIGRTWYALYRTSPEKALPIADYKMADHAPYRHMITCLFEPRPSPSRQLLHTVEKMLPLWSRDRGKLSFFADILPRHGDVVADLIEFGISADTTRQLSLSGGRSVSWERHATRKLLMHLEGVAALNPRIDRLIEAAPELALSVCEAAAWDEAIVARVIEAITPIGEADFDDSLRLTARLVANGYGAGLLAVLRDSIQAESDVDLLARFARDYSGKCIDNGESELSIEAIDLVLDLVEASSRPDLLYNKACAFAQLGDPVAAASALGEAIAMDPHQARDARGDADFDPVRDHPAVTELLQDDR